VLILHLEIIAMAVLVLLIGISLLVAIGFLMSFFWSVKDGQYDDDYTPSVRMLFDDELLENQSKK
jgi:cbb3-type cytochrome oxidase maturation protein